MSASIIKALPYVLSRVSNPSYTRPVLPPLPLCRPPAHSLARLRRCVVAAAVLCTYCSLLRDSPEDSRGRAAKERRALLGHALCNRESIHYAESSLAQSPLGYRVCCCIYYLLSTQQINLLISITSRYQCRLSIFIRLRQVASLLQINYYTSHCAN